jgi:hypothetical protein
MTDAAQLTETQAILCLMAGLVGLGFLLGLSAKDWINQWRASAAACDKTDGEAPQPFFLTYPAVAFKHTDSGLVVDAPMPWALPSAVRRTPSNETDAPAA